MKRKDRREFMVATTFVLVVLLFLGIAAMMFVWQREIDAQRYICANHGLDPFTAFVTKYGSGCLRGGRVIFNRDLVP